MENTLNLIKNFSTKRNKTTPYKINNVSSSVKNPLETRRCNSSIQWNSTNTFKPKSSKAIFQRKSTKFNHNNLFSISKIKINSNIKTTFLLIAKQKDLKLNFILLKYLELTTKNETIIKFLTTWNQH